MIIAMADRFEIFSQGNVEIGKEVAEEHMTLLICLYEANLNGMVESVLVVG
jgi:hypothetical protein